MPNIRHSNSLESEGFLVVTINMSLFGDPLCYRIRAIATHTHTHTERDITPNIGYEEHGI
jgi:hypothetical protein